MKVFLINLDVNTDRFAVADRQLKQLGVDYERFPAVYGKTMPKEERKAAVNRFRWWCAIGRPIAPAEIGCALSHYRIYQRMLDESIPYACILEDDVVLKPAFGAQLEFVASHINPASPQVILLSNHTPEHCETQRLKETRADMFTEAYVVTQAAAKALLQANLPMQVPCDHWGRWVKRGVIQLYHAFPTVATQDQVTFASSTSEGRVNPNTLSRYAYFCHKVKRAFGRSLDIALEWLA